LNLVQNTLSTFSLQGTWYLAHSQNLGLKLTQADYSDAILTAASYSEFIVSLHYGYTF
jgi:hypothetical protein